MELALVLAACAAFAVAGICAGYLLNDRQR